jgi:hypothetical protein
VSLILRGPGGKAYRAPGVLFWITTVDYWDFVMMREKPEKSLNIVSALEFIQYCKGF